uniref:Ig-like domain-containing protein n=1 Tax=Sciurus vulgaris TaxID=55149 RepID=A0A8D2DQB1_SCIVU
VETPGESYLSKCDTQMTESPSTLSASQGDRITITCQVSQNTYNSLAWYQQKPGQSPRLLIYQVSNMFTGFPDRFSGSGSRTDFTLTIIRVEAEDAGVYYCIQATHDPPTVVQPQTKTSLLGWPSCHMCCWSGSSSADCVCERKKLQLRALDLGCHNQGSVTTY